MELTTSYQKIKEVYLGNTGYGNVYLRNYAKYNQQDITNNKTQVSVQMRIYTEGGYWLQQSGGYWAIGLTDNTSISGQANQRFEVGETTINTLTGWVNHNSDGTKTNCACACEVNFVEWGWSNNANTTVSLPTIPRTSKLNSVSMSIASNGNSISVTPNITKYSSSFYDSLIIKDGNTTIATLDGVTHNTAKSLSSAQITAVYNAIGTGTSKTFTAYIITYSNSSKTTTIGTSSSVSFTATLPSYSITASVSVQDTVSAYNTYKPNTSTYIANLSKPKFTLSASSSTGSYYGRSVSYKSGNTTISNPYTDNNHTGQSYSFTATDGRKTSSAVTPTMTHIPYFKPTLITSVTRPTPTGSTVSVSVSGSYYDGDGLTNLLTPTAILTYTEQGGSQQQVNITLSTSTSNHKVSFTGSTTLSDMDYQKSVTWNVTLTDRINITTTNSNTLPQGLPVWNGYRKNDENYFNVNGIFSVNNIITNKREYYGTSGQTINANDITTEGVYLFDVNVTVTNRPPKAGNGMEFLIVMSTKMTNCCIQIWFNSEHALYFRLRNWGTFDVWKKITITSV